MTYDIFGTYSNPTSPVAMNVNATPFPPFYFNIVVERKGAKLAKAEPDVAVIQVLYGVALYFQVPGLGFS